MTVKKLEIPAYDPRASFTQALGYMTSPTRGLPPPGRLCRLPGLLRRGQGDPAVQPAAVAHRHPQHAEHGHPPGQPRRLPLHRLRLRRRPLGPDDERRHRPRLLRRPARARSRTGSPRSNGSSTSRPGSRRRTTPCPTASPTSPIVVEGRKSGPCRAEDQERMKRDYYRVRGWDADGRPDAGASSTPCGSGRPGDERSEMAGDRRSLPRVPGPRPGLAPSTTSRTATAATWPSAGGTSAARTRSSSRPRARRKATSSRARSASCRPRRPTTAITRRPPRRISTPASSALPGVRASMHAHLKDLILATLDDAPKPAAAPGLRPRRPAGPSRPRRLPPGRLVRRAERLARAGPDDPRTPGRASPDHHLRPRRHGQGPEPARRRSTGSAWATTPDPSSVAWRSSASTWPRCAAPIAADPAARLRRAAPGLQRSTTTTARISATRRRSCREFVKAGHRIFESAPLALPHGLDVGPRRRRHALRAQGLDAARRGRPPAQRPARAGPGRRRGDGAPQGHLRRERFPDRHALPRRGSGGVAPITSIPANRPRPTASSPSTPRARSSTSSSPSCPPTPGPTRSSAGSTITSSSWSGVAASGPSARSRSPRCSTTRPPCARSVSTASGPSSAASTSAAWSLPKPSAGERRPYPRPPSPFAPSGGEASPPKITPKGYCPA